MKNPRLMTVLTISLLFASVLIGCITPNSTRHYSSVVQYLYPNKDVTPQKPGIPLLSLPIDVGIAFVPEPKEHVPYLTEKEKLELMKELGGYFKKYDFVRKIEFIPTQYMVQDGSFTNMDQVAMMFGVDVIALISYDQVQFTDRGVASITYWTLIGAYVVPGEKNTTHTMLDAAVYDIRSRKMLFRAPGVNHLKGNATPINISEQLRLDKKLSFDEARVNLAANLDEQLQLFKDKVKETPEEYKVVNKPGYTGAGSIDFFLLLPFIISGVLALRSLRGKR
ncbi:MAG: rhombotarget lipoprotein [Nitrospiraceae bacterium]|nr:MAG: rhombotarget lipoprotein [Nitrospiraceae bacterium]